MVASAGQFAQAEQSKVSIHIELKPEAIVSRRYVTIADIAQVSSADLVLKNAIEVLRVAEAPRIGFIEQLTRNELSQLIRSRLTSLPQAPEWDGANSVKVRSASRLVTADTFVDLAKRSVLKELRGKFEHVEVDLTSSVADIALPLGEASFVVRPIEQKHVYARLPVWIDVVVEGVVYRSVIVPFNIRVSQKVLVARRDLPEGAVVSSEDFSSKVEDVSAISDELVSVADVQGRLHVKRPLGSGQILTRKYVSLPGAVSRGDVVRLVVAEGGVLIETRAVAEQEGVIGQRVKVKTDQGTGAISGRIVSAGVVQANERY